MYTGTICKTGKTSGKINYDGNKKVFVPANEFPDDIIPEVGTLVEFEISDFGKGPCAHNITIIEQNTYLKSASGIIINLYDVDGDIQWENVLVPFKLNEFDGEPDIDMDVHFELWEDNNQNYFAKCVVEQEKSLKIPTGLLAKDRLKELVPVYEHERGVITDFELASKRERLESEWNVLVLDNQNRKEISINLQAQLDLLPKLIENAKKLSAQMPEYRQPDYEKDKQFYQADLKANKKLIEKQAKRIKEIEKLLVDLPIYSGDQLKQQLGNIVDFEDVTFEDIQYTLQEDIGIKTTSVDRMQQKLAERKEQFNGSISRPVKWIITGLKTLNSFF